MNKERFMNMTDILNHGLGSQNKLSDLNKLVTARINAADYSHVHRLFEELLSIAGETDIKQMAQKEERLDGLCSDLSGIKIDLLKETELLRSLRFTNDCYIDELQKDIKEAEAYLNPEISGTVPNGSPWTEALKKRIRELMLTKSVGISFSEQIILAESNLRSLCERINDVLINLIPLLRGRISTEHSRLLIPEIRNMISGI